MDQLWQTIQQGLNTRPVQHDSQVTFLILGTDSLATRGNVPPLTDTIMLLNLNLKTGQLSSYSLPRDLWLPEVGAKINALYAFGQQEVALQRLTQATQVPVQKIETLTGVKIDHVIVISLDTLGKLIDEVGGVEINIPESFTDPLFPREDVDVRTERDPAKLYKTVTFTAGPETMNAQRALEYVRSRHASGNQGSDTARALRQQQVIASLLTKLKSPQFWTIPQKAGQLWAFYQREFGSQLPLTELIAIGKYILPRAQELKLQPAQTSVYPESATGVIYHPPLYQTKQEWAYLIKDQKAFQQEVQTKLGIASSSAVLR
jgi:LCP family protein required for cell wall assembly